MAYGKDESQLNRVVPYGGNMSQRARHYTNSRKQASESRRGGGAPYWKNVLKCPTTHSRLIRLIPGQYAQDVSYDDETVVHEVFEYYMFKEHYHGTSGRGGICSAGPLFRNKDKSEPCEGCTMFWEDIRERRAKKARGDKSKGPNRMSLRDQYVFTVWDYGLWLNVPRTDQNGNIITGQNGTPYYDWQMAPPGDPRVNQLEHKYGNLVAWPMGETYKDTLLQYNDRTVRNDCSTCGTMGGIRCVMKICGNPNCEHPVYDPADTTMSPEQREKLENEPYTCPVCGQTNFINEMIECQTCLQNGWEPRRATIFDIDLEVTAVGTKGQQTVLQILQRSNPRPIQIADPELLKTVAALDLAKQFSPTPVEKQRELWGISSHGGQVQQPGQGQAPSMPSMMGQGMQQQPMNQQPQMGMQQQTQMGPQGQGYQTQHQQPMQQQQPQQPAMPQMGTGVYMPGLAGGNFGGQQ